MIGFLQDKPVNAELVPSGTKEKPDVP